MGSNRSTSAASPLEEALREDVLVAHGMNGSPLLPQHGFPLRLVVPGWYGMASVKWLTAITVVEKPFTGYQQINAYRFRLDENDEGVPLTRMMPRALMIPPGLAGFPERERTVTAGPCHVEGRAWSGWASVEAVEFSVDGGRAGPKPSSTRKDRAGRGAGGSTNGKRLPVSTFSAAAHATPPATCNPTTRTGTSAATPTTAFSACR